MIRLLLIALLIATPALAQGAPAPTAPSAAVSPAAPGNAGDIVVNMHDVEISAVAEQISRLTGRTLILDPQVRGTVNVTSATPLSANGVWELFQSVLRVHGFTAVRAGRAWRIVPQADAVRETSSVAAGPVTTRLIRLRNVSPETAARIFRPLVAQFGSVEPLTSPPAIVVTDYADNIARIERLAASLDSGGGAGFATIQLRIANAKDVGAAIRSLYGEGENGPRVAIDERSNSLIVRGSPVAVADARRMVSQLDRPGGGTPTLRVFRLRQADAEAVTQVLSGLMGGQTQSANPVARTLSDTAFGAGATGTQGTGSPGASALAAGGISGIGSSGSGTMGSTSGSGGASATLPLNNSGSSGPSVGFSTPDLAVQASTELNAIVVRGSPAAIAQIQPLIEQLDVRRPQVLIEAAIVEVNSDVAESLGVQFGVGGDLPHASGAISSFGTNGTSLSGVLSALGAKVASFATDGGITGAIGGHDFQILIQALASSTKANLLSTPSITTLDNQPAQIIVGQNVPFKTGSYTTVAGSTTTPFTTIERQDVGLTLKIIPRVHEGDTIRLDVSQEVSSIAGAVTGAADLVTNRRAIQTTVLADDGQTIVLGGLISDDRMDTKSQVPVLGDLPLVGNLFKDRKLEQTKRTLFVFLRPTILRTAAEVSTAADGKYLRLRGAEYGLSDHSSLLLEPPRARLPVELEGIY
ncbi:general secretion pathway protein D [Sphingomonas vulcanisoli]|uniref:General secretion pathway protein D n=1 Tax=Sphingomonas vulcanisoli TaxID=1658060 RepID=A0ABX0TTK5_9SPHN|nr:type II secretion system secretin GspD [Sphingomonas vulcanisoli]NIJ07737.1 general secretion pathway protein D [Sphingomonas vulcanisoli]